MDKLKGLSRSMTMDKISEYASNISQKANEAGLLYHYSLFHIKSRMGQKQAKFPVEALPKLQQKTNFTKEQLIELYNEFHEEYPELFMTKSQFMAKIKHEILQHANCTETFINFLFNAFDSDKNGTIDFEEYIQGLYLITGASDDERLTFSFRLLDLDGNGMITKEEMLTGLESYESLIEDTNRIPPAEVVKRIFHDLDQENIGEIDMEEFKRTLLHSKSAYLMSYFTF